MVRFTIDENTFMGIIFGQNYHYVIRPAKDYTQNSEDDSFIVYKSWDIIPDANDFDYINNALEVANDDNMELFEQVTFRNSSGCSYILRIATDADFEFHQAKGGTNGSAASPTNNSIRSEINLIEGVYLSTFGISIVIGNQYVVNTSANQPYTSTNSLTLLSQFQSHWITNRSTVERDIAHLFTGKILDKGIDGHAFMGIGNSAGYSLSRNQTDMYQTIAHEIGHNLNANDNPSNCSCATPSASVMCTGQKSSNLWFCTTSINEISTFLFKYVTAHPAVSRFYMQGTSFNYGYITDYVSTCPGEPISLTPDIPAGVGTIYEYKIQTTGVSAQVSSSTGVITFTAPTTIRATFTILFCYRTGCGWSEWKKLSGSIRDCDAGEDPWKSPGQVDKSSSFYPSPVSNILHIDVKQTVSANTVYDIRLYSLMGSQLRQLSANSGMVAQIDVSKLPDGIYYVHIYDGISSTPDVYKIVIKH